jgi:hypothetical protein
MLVAEAEANDVLKGIEKDHMFIQVDELPFHVSI